MKNTAEKIFNIGAYKYYMEHEGEETGAFGMHMLEDLMYYGDVADEAIIEDDEIKPEIALLLLAYIKLFEIAKDNTFFWNYLYKLMHDDNFAQLIQGQMKVYSHPLMQSHLSYDFDNINEAIEALSEIVERNFWDVSHGSLEEDHFDRLLQFADDVTEIIKNDTPYKIWEKYGYDTYEYFAEFGILWESCERIIYTT